MTIPGEIVRLAGREVRRHVHHGSQPGVLLLGGCGVPSSAWGPVLTRLENLQVVTVDRPGMGGSQWPGTLPTLADEVRTLAVLIADEEGPVVVVAHSMAGLHAEALARQHPELVAGLVLVDASVEWERQGPGHPMRWLRLARAARRAGSAQALLPIVSLAGRVLFAVQSKRRLVDPLDPVTREIFRSRESAAMIIAEQAAYGSQVNDLEDVRKRWPMPDVPVIVLTATGDGGGKWRRDQERLAQLLDGRQVVDEDARHLIMIDRPDLVADAVRAMHEDPDSPPEGQE